MSLRVCFNDNVQIRSTYSNDDYDRFSIDHVLYRKAYNRVSEEEMRTIYVNLDLYKLYEMPVHKQSMKNTMFHVKHVKVGQYASQ